VIRIGRPWDSSLVARQIGDRRLVICAAPAYLQRRGVPQKPADIPAHHQCLMFRDPASGQLRPWQQQHNRRALTLKPASAIVMNDGEALVAAAIAGLGLVQAPDNMAQGAIDAGQLLPVLPRFQAPALPVSLVYASQRSVTPRLRVLIDALSAQAAR
jgi:LysR family transcriptional regulator for bpeEF and oprC